LYAAISILYPITLNKYVIGENIIEIYGRESVLDLE
jgi:hypothetical protein